MLACSASEGAIDAIRDQTFLLADALAREGVEVEVRMRQRDGTWATSGGARFTRLEDDLAADQMLVLAYQPFLYGKWGFSPWLPVSLWRLRRRANHPFVALFVHERPVPARNLRWALMGLWQRFELLALQHSVDVALVTIPSWRRSLRRRLAERAVHVPVGSSLPDVAVERAPRAEGRVVLTLFGTAQPVRRLDHAVAAANAVAATGRDVTLLNLGAGAQPLAGLDPRIDVHTTGPLEPEAIARRLAETDVFLAPFTDGVSTRRTTVMAALQRGLAIVGTEGFLTDELLRETNAIRLVPAGDHERFVAAVLELCGEPEQRNALGAAAATLYRTEFDWPVAARRVIAALGIEHA